jgi:AraC-like DNA-binding protein
MDIKKRDSLFISLLFLLFIQLSSTAQPIEQLELKNILIAKIDSCNNNLLQLDENRKVEMLRLANTTNEYMLLSNFFEQKKLYGEHYHVLMNKYIYENKLDSVYLYYQETLKYYLKDQEQSRELVHQLLSTYISWCAVNNYLELAANSIKQLNEYNWFTKTDNNLWIYLSWMHIYGIAGKYEQVIESAKIGLKLAKATTDVRFSPVFKMLFSHQIAESYYVLGDYQNCLLYSDSTLIYIDDIPDEVYPEFGANFRKLALIDFYSLRSVYYSSIKDFEQASLMLQKLNTLVPEVQISGSPINLNIELLAQINWVYIIYNHEKGDYSKAMVYLNTSKELGTGSALFPDYKNLVKWETLIYEKMGKYEQAYQIIKEEKHFTDSISRVNTTKEISSLWAVFEVDKAQQAKEKSELRANRFYIISISASIVVLISIVLIVYFIVSNRKLKEKNRILFRQQKGQLSSIPFIDNRKEKSIQEVNSIMSNQEEVQQNAEQALYLQIIEYLQTTKQYTDPDISRESLAKELGTNRQYVIDAISNNAQMSFSEFINNFRLEYARDLLLSPENLMIKQIYTDAGFNNRSSFALLFKEKFGMTPSEFRDCVKEELLVR